MSACCLPTNAEAMDIIQHNKDFFIENLILDEDFLNACENEDLLTRRQRRKIVAESLATTQKAKFMALLPKLGRDTVAKFRLALRQTRQESLLNHIMEDGELPSTILKPVIDEATALSLSQQWLSVAASSPAIDIFHTCHLSNPPTVATAIISIEPAIHDHFTAPEMCTVGCERQHDEKSFVWNVGCALIAAMSGKCPWNNVKKRNLKTHIAKNAEEIFDYVPKQISSRMKGLLTKMLEVNVHKRKTASSLLALDVFRELDVVDNKQKKKETEELAQVTDPFYSKAKDVMENLAIRHKRVGDKMWDVFEKSSNKNSSSMRPIDLWTLLKTSFTCAERHKIAYLNAAERGCTILHAIISSKIEEEETVSSSSSCSSFLEVFFNLGLWSLLIDVQNMKDRLTPSQIASKNNYTKTLNRIQELSLEEDSMSNFHKAARSGDKETVEKMINDDKMTPYDIDERNSLHGKSALFWAATSGNLSLMQILIDNGAEASRCTTDEANTSILGRVVSLNHSHLVTPLIKKWGVCPEEKRNYAGIKRPNPLCIAGQNGHLETLQALLGVGVQLTGLALTAAIMARPALKMEFITLLTDKYKVSSNWKDIFGKTPFLAATAAGQTDVMLLLLQRDANPTLVDKRFRNVLHFAVEGGNLDAVELAVKVCKERGVLEQMLNAKDRFSGSENIFLVRGKDKGRPAWHYVEVKRPLLKMFQEKTRGGPVDVAQYGPVVQSGWGANPPKTVMNDIEKRYNPDQIPPNAQADLTPLMLAIAAKASSFKIVKRLVDENPDPKTTDCYGSSALHLASMRGRNDIVQLLVEKGKYSTIAKDGEDNTPLDVARRNGNIEVMSYLSSREIVDRVGKFQVKMMGLLETKMSKELLLQQQKSGQNVRTFVLDTCREMENTLNALLFHLGSSLVAQPSDAAVSEK